MLCQPLETKQYPKNEGYQISHRERNGQDIHDLAK